MNCLYLGWVYQDGYKDININETSLAELYNLDIMPPTLRKAHQKLDKAVDKLYQKTGSKTPLERVKHLFQLYQKLCEQM